MPSVREEDVQQGHLVVPAAGGPGVVLVHDVWGLYDHFRDLARRLAAEGFVVLALDAYRGFAERPRPEDPGAFMRELSDPDVLATIQAAVDRLRAHPEVAGRPVGVIGFCMGGSYTLLAAARVRGIAAAVPFYGILSYSHGLYAGPPLDPRKKPESPLDVAAEVRCPVLAFFGEDDTLITGADVRALEERARTAGHPFAVQVFGGAGHAFVNDTRPQLYRPEQARDAWSRMVSFLKAHLGTGAAR